MKRKLLFAMLCIASALGLKAQTSTWTGEEGKVYLRNVESGTWWGAGNDWGTRASLVEHPEYVTLVKNGDTYKLESQVSNDENNTKIYFNGDYMDDANPIALTITQLDNGHYTITNGENVYGNPASGTVLEKAASITSVAAQWDIFTQDDMMKALESASSENPIDATFLILDANFGRNNRNVGAWTAEASNKNLSGGNMINNCAESYRSTFTISQAIANAPAGVYKLTAQGFYRQDGSDYKNLPYFFANDHKVTFLERTGSENSMSAASVSFTNGLYTNFPIAFELSEGGTLTIGAKNDTNTLLWCIFDNFVLTYYGKEVEPTELLLPYWDELVKEANAILSDDTYKNVTGSEYTTLSTLVEGNYTTVDEYLAAASVMPNAIKDFTAAKNAYDEYFYEKQTAERLETDITSVATPQTAAEAEAAAHAINVLNYHKVVDAGYYDVSEAVLGAWTDNNVGDMTSQHWDGTATSAYFEQAEGLYGNTSWSMSREQTVTLTSGKYILKVAARVSALADATLSVTSGGETISTVLAHHGDTGRGITTDGEASYEDGKTYANNNNGRGFEWKYIPFTVTDVEGEATLAFNAEGYAQYQYVSFTSLAILTTPETAAKTKLLAAINSVNQYGVNVGDAAFQIPTTALTTLQAAQSEAQTVYSNENATLEDLTNATETLLAAIETYKAAELNHPTEGQLFNIVLTYPGYAYDNKAVTYLAGGRTDAGNYNMQYQEAANTNLAQAFTFTHVSGNNYKLSQIDADGESRYISTGTVYGGNTAQIRTTTDAEKALEVTVILTEKEGVYNLYNTEAKEYIGSQDAGVYTVNSHINFLLKETTKPSITINTTAAGWGTVMLPFAVAKLPEGVKAYSCAEVEENGATLVLTAAEKLEANKPYIIEGAWEDTLTGDAQGTALTYTDGLLTGVYAETTAPEGSYVLQNQDGVVGFYLVDSEIEVPANRAYLTVANGGDVKGFFFGSDDATAVKGIEAAGEEAGAIYNLAGQRVEKAVKGVYIINGKKVLVK